MKKVATIGRLILAINIVFLFPSLANSDPSDNKPKLVECVKVTNLVLGTQRDGKAQTVVFGYVSKGERFFISSRSSLNEPWMHLVGYSQLRGWIQKQKLRTVNQNEEEKALLNNANAEVFEAVEDSDLVKLDDGMQKNIVVGHVKKGDRFILQQARQQAVDGVLQQQPAEDEEWVLLSAIKDLTGWVRSNALRTVE